MLLPLFSEDKKYLAGKLCQRLLETYQYLNNLSPNLLTPRELIMTVQLSLLYSEKFPKIAIERFFEYFSYQISKPFVPANKALEFDKRFSVERPEYGHLKLLGKRNIILTESNICTANMVTDFLRLRQSLITDNTPNTMPMGLGGVTITGEPGLGKTELAMACLKAQGLIQRFIYGSSKPKSQNYFYHLPAGANINTKKDILIRAFHEGAVVLSDEINTAASLESLLNRLLMGKGPNGELPTKPGFMMVCTQNPITMAGRASTSKAMLHRMHHCEIPHYTKDEMHTILCKMGLPKTIVEPMIEQYMVKQQTDKLLCFRNIIKRAKREVKKIFHKSADNIVKHDLNKIVNKHWSSSDKLEAIYNHYLCDDNLKIQIIKHPKLSSDFLNKITESIFSSGAENSLLNQLDCDAMKKLDSSQYALDNNLKISKRFLIRRVENYDISRFFPHPNTRSNNQNKFKAALANTF